MKNLLLKVLRRLGLVQSIDKLYFLFNKIKWEHKNKQFKTKNFSTPLPPEYMLYEAYKLDYQEYIEDGKQTAQWMIDCISPFVKSMDKKILEWGCGPARVIRHLPGLLPESKIYGSDYNKDSIRWCNQHISGVTFKTNELRPPIQFDSGFFDVVYALSVFTHLSPENHQEWILELHRVLKADGVLLFTTQGNIFTEKLTASERRLFQQGNIVVRSQTKEGHRSYSAFHPPSFIQTLFANSFNLLEFVPGKTQNWGLEQDTWILRKVS